MQYISKYYVVHQLKIVEKRSFTKTSEVLILTQPSVSIQFKKFQEQFPFPFNKIIGKLL
jgi:hypothetical protein